LQVPQRSFGEPKNLWGKEFLICLPYNTPDVRRKRSPSQRSSRTKAAACLLGVGLWLTACQPTPQSIDPTAQPPPQSELGPADPGQPAPTSADPTAQTAPSQPTAHTIRTELAATDPSTVDLTSGRPTLVEFFAFW